MVGNERITFKIIIIKVNIFIIFFVRFFVDCGCTFLQKRYTQLVYYCLQSLKLQEINTNLILNLSFFLLVFFLPYFNISEEQNLGEKKYHFSTLKPLSACKLLFLRCCKRRLGHQPENQSTNARKERLYESSNPIRDK